MNAKDLKALAKACRAAGIKTFKNQEVEFTLSDITPVSNYKKRMVKSSVKTLDPNADLSLLADDIESDGWNTMTREQQLFWSAERNTDENIS